jgi:hypothetical protein
MTTTKTRTKTTSPPATLISNILPEASDVTKLYFIYRNMECLRKSEIVMHLVNRLGIPNDAAVELFRLMCQDNRLQAVAVDGDVTHYRWPSAEEKLVAEPTPAAPVPTPAPAAKMEMPGIGRVSIERYTVGSRQFDTLQEAVEYCVAPDEEMDRYCQETGVGRRHIGILRHHVRKFLAWRRAREGAHEAA